MKFLGRAFNLPATQPYIGIQANDLLEESDFRGSVVKTLKKAAMQINDLHFFCFLLRNFILS